MKDLEKQYYVSVRFAIVNEFQADTNTYTQHQHVKDYIIN